MKKELDEILQKLWESRIDLFQFDFNSHQIKLDLLAIEGNQQYPYEVVFNEVASFLFVNGKGEKRFNMLPWEYVELSELHRISINEEVLVTTTGKNEDIYSHSIRPNIVLEIWSAEFYIEVKSIIINGINYELNEL